MKLQGLFYQASPSLYGTDVLSAGVGAPFADTSSVFTTHLGTSANGTNYYVVRQIANTYGHDNLLSLHMTNVEDFQCYHADLFQAQR